MNALEKLRALDEERTKVLEEAQAAALERAHNAIRELGELGLHYALTQETHAPKAGGRSIDRPHPTATPAFDQTLCGS